MNDKLTDPGSAGRTQSSGKAYAPATSFLPPFISHREIPPEALFPPAALLLIHKIARTALPLLVIGEQGLGQGYLSRLLHTTGFTKGEPFLELHLAADKSENDVEALSHLLQTIHSGNSFKGTLHIHGLDNASRLLQTWLVSMLEDETVRFPDGRQIRFEGRIAASVFQPLEQVLDHSGMVPELMYKVAIAPVLLKPLRERSNTIPHLADIFIKAYEKRLLMNARNLTPQAIQCLQDYPWPGNVSELESVVYRSLLFSSSSSLDAEDIIFEMEPQRTVPADDAATLVPQQDPLPELQVTTGSSLELSIAHLVAELSHEIKNPLVAIKTFIQLLPGHINDPEFLSDFFGVAATSIDRIDYLTERMLEFAKFSQPRAMSIQLAAVLQEVMKKIGSLTPPLQIRWNHDAFENIPSLTADQEQVCYALENILFHIAHNAPAGQMVEFSVDETPAAIALSMSYAGEKQAQGLAFSSAQGEMISDLNGLDLFLAHQVLQKNAIRCTKDTEHTKTIITIQFPRAMKIAEGDSSR